MGSKILGKAAQVGSQQFSALNPSKIHDCLFSQVVHQLAPAIFPCLTTFSVTLMLCKYSGGLSNRHRIMYSNYSIVAVLAT
jgi:hypothetical protein